MRTSSATNGDRRILRALLLHVGLPLLATLALIGLYYMPVTAIGCANRGIAALVVAVFAGLGALLTGWRASQICVKGDGRPGWWLASTIILVVPIILLIWPLG